MSSWKAITYMSEMNEMRLFDAEKRFIIYNL